MAHSTINQVTCGVCGYDMRGLDRDGDCPECGTPIVEAIRINKPGTWSQAWLAARNIIAGLFLIVLALSVFVHELDPPFNGRFRQLFFSGVFGILAATFFISAQHRAQRGKWAWPIGQATKVALCIIFGLIAVVMAVIQLLKAL